MPLTLLNRPARIGISGIYVLLLVAAPLAGCVSKSKAKAQERAAYLRGQQEAVARMQQLQVQAQGPYVTINGEVHNHVVPWTQGLNLAQALVAADYCGPAEPGQIIILHNGVATRLDPKQLLAGVEVLLQPGDVVQLMPQPMPAQR